MKAVNKALLFLILLLIIPFAPAAAQTSDRLQVVATTTLIADVARNVGGDLVVVSAVIPAGADSHTYNLTPRDVAGIAIADVVLVNGAFLEESLLNILEVAASVEPVVVSVGVPVLGAHAHDEDDDHEADDHHDDGDHASSYEVIGILDDSLECSLHDDDDHEEAGDHDDDDAHEEDGHDHGDCDPHFWTDPANVMIWAANIAAAFAAADPDNAAIYEANAAAYIAQLEALDAEIRALVESVPPENRVIVTNHEFLAYFAHAYGFEVVGTVIPSVSTLAEVNPQTIIALVEVIRAEGVRAIFAEISAAQALAQAVAAEAGFDVQVVTLYSDSLSPADGPAATYIDFMRHNVTTVVEAMGG